MLSINGRIEWRRVRYYSPGEGSDSPIDQLVDVMESAISVGMRELCCRMGIAGRSFARSMENLHEAAQIRMSEEMLRNVVESDGKAVLKASAEEQLEIDWSGADCKAQTPTGQEVSRLYASADGVLLPTTTEAEKQKRRATVLGKRQKMSRKQRQRLTRLGRQEKGGGVSLEGIADQLDQTLDFFIRAV